MKLIAPNMSGWSIIDYELAIDGLRQVNEAVIWLQNQPRAARTVGEYHPGADFVVQIGEEWCGLVIDRIIARLETIRFNDPKDDDRRVKLLVTHYCQDHDLPMLDLVALIERERSKQAA